MTDTGLVTRRALEKEREDWLAKFYPIPADRCPKEDALAHSILKWGGLLLENLPKNAAVPIDVTSSTCALCQYYNEYSEHDGNGAYFPCGKCPLYLSRDGVPCDQVRGGDDLDVSPYSAWSMFRNPKPMIKALAKAKAFVENGGK